MTEAPKTLAEQIRALEPTVLPTDACCLATFNLGWIVARGQAAALAEQASPAVRVKPLVWVKHPTSEIWRCDTPHGTYKVFGIGSPSWDYDSATVASDCTSRTAATVADAKAAAQSDYAARITAAIEPDPTPALSWRAMQTAAAGVAYAALCKYAEDTYASYDGRLQNAAKIYAAGVIHADILALPGPTSAQLLAEALKLPDVQELVLGTQWARNRLDIIADESWRGDGRDLKRSIIGIFADFDAALAKIGEAK